MTKNEKILFDLLKEKGFNAKVVYYYPTFGYLYGGWIATVIGQDEDGHEFDCEYHLGNDFIEAKGQIENNEITKIE
ncbi:hypothetical protein [Abyssalbus ytuae]|uniref:Uncharacterized protein n=1 Tax=Abyssalbus ytuae TaxID=2926907 RepID=A0A9E6ZJ88_9FLAO|nr:hypothetical protein [Abyssalbus ytuae]UOB16574.1 hypothetical protein MQE35_12615 [Abyssalbus ytuae]